MGKVGTAKPKGNVGYQALEKEKVFTRVPEQNCEKRKADSSGEQFILTCSQVEILSQEAPKCNLADSHAWIILTDEPISAEGEK